MNDADKPRFRALMEELGSAYGQDISGKLHAYWRVLCARMDIDTLAGAIDAHLADAQRGRFFPLPADLIAACETAGGHPSADEAWAICLESFDEETSVVVTAQILEARRSAQPVMDEGDNVGARMAFKAAYERIVRAAPAKPVWQFSAGHDPAQRAELAERALQQGLLQHEQVARYLPAPAPSALAQQITGLLTGQVAAEPAETDDHARAHIAEIKRVIAAQADQAEQARRARTARAEHYHRQRVGPSIAERTAAIECALAARQAT